MNTRSSSMLMLLAAVTITTTTSTAVNPLGPDAEALLDFYGALPSGGIRLKWENKEKVCDWFGITCKSKQDQTQVPGGKGRQSPVSPSDNRVVAVRLPAVGLYGPIAPKTISRLDALEVLSLRENSLYGMLPPDILSIPSLKFLHLQNNKFCGDLPAFVNPSPKLEKVDFSSNCFSGTIPTVFSKIPTLYYLNLSHNLFSGTIPNSDLPESLKLYLGYNNLTGPIPPSIRKLNLKKDSFEENPDLCGKPLDNRCDSHPPDYPPSPNPAYSNKLGAIALVGSSLLLFLLL